MRHVSQYLKRLKETYLKYKLESCISNHLIEEVKIHCVKRVIGDSKEKTKKLFNLETAMYRQVI